MRRPDQVAVVACVLGLLLVAASAGGDAPGSVAAVADLMLGGAMVVLAGVLVALRNCRAAWPFALVARLGFGGTALAMRAVHVRQGPHSTRASWSRNPRLPGARLLADRDDQLLAGSWAR